MSNDDRTGTPGNEPRVPDPLPPAIGTRMLTCPHCKAQFPAPTNIEVTQCPACFRHVAIATPTYTRSA